MDFTISELFYELVVSQLSFLDDINDMAECRYISKKLCHRSVNGFSIRYWNDSTISLHHFSETIDIPKISS